MARAQAQFLKLTDTSGIVRERWQSYWSTQVPWSSQQWDYVAFVADGFVEGDSGTEQSISVKLPATPRAVVSCERALAAGWVAELQIYQFDDFTAAAGPISTQELIAQFNGQVVGAAATVTAFTLELGSALAPVGATVPPRTLTTAIMGAGCRL
jgi:hypothetical protein